MSKSRAKLAALARLRFIESLHLANPDSPVLGARRLWALICYTFTP